MKVFLTDSTADVDQKPRSGVCLSDVVFSFFKKLCKYMSVHIFIEEKEEREETDFTKLNFVSKIRSMAAAEEGFKIVREEEEEEAGVGVGGPKTTETRKEAPNVGFAWQWGKDKEEEQERGKRWVERQEYEYYRHEQN